MSRLNIRKGYATDVTEKECQRLEPLVPAPPGMMQNHPMRVSVDLANDVIRHTDSRLFDRAADPGIGTSRNLVPAGRSGWTLLVAGTLRGLLFTSVFRVTTV